MEVQGDIPRYNSIGKLERVAAMSVMGASGSAEPLSGFLGGEERGGFWVRALEDKWAERFKVPHAIACNSATSGLLAAAAAASIKNHYFLVPTLTMSATAAAPMVLGGKPHFLDAEEQFFSPGKGSTAPGAIRAVFVTSLFGHPAYLKGARQTCDDLNWLMIEDASQSPLATENDKFVGTIGDIGVFSLNVHKHFQAGEGGIIVTNSDELALRMRLFINHSELSDCRVPGLNLRMTEITAAIAFAQLARAPDLVRGRIDQAERILAAIGDIPGLRKPSVREGCRHVYYTIPFLVEKNRPEIVSALRAEGVPLSQGYLPIHRLPAFEAFATPCPVADDLHDRRLFYFENCAWSPTDDQIKQIGNAFQKVMEKMNAMQ